MSLGEYIIVSLLLTCKPDKITVLFNPGIGGGNGIPRDHIELNFIAAAQQFWLSVRDGNYCASLPTPDKITNTNKFTRNLSVITVKTCEFIYFPVIDFFNKQIKY